MIKNNNEKKKKIECGITYMKIKSIFFGKKNSHWKIIKMIENNYTAHNNNIPETR